MEINYRDYFIGSNADRLNRICRYFFLVLIPLRAYPLIYWTFSPGSINNHEVLEALWKVIGAFAIGGLFLISKNWGRGSKYWLGFVFLGIIRVGWIVGIFQQVRGHSNSQTVTSFVSMVCISGFVMPNFVEYLCMACLVSYLRPLQICLTLQPAGDWALVRQILYQNTLILALGVSINWAFHSDLRRDWLRSPAVLGENSKARRSHEEKAAENWDALADAYFTDADRRELRSEALQV